MAQGDATTRQPDETVRPSLAPPIDTVKHLGPIRLIRQIGKGGMGVVWLGRHELLGNQVAVKILSTAIMDRTDPAFTEFIQGAKIAASITHPGLNKIVHADVVDGVPYLVLEFLDGPNLSDLLKRFGRLNLAVVRAVIEAVCEAVSELHHHDLVHRDLKPSNVVLTTDGRVVVTDFGLACARPASAIRGSVGAVSGTPLYMAPEMFEGIVSARTDVYAIGITTYQLLCGQTAFSGTFEELQSQHKTAAIDLEPLRSAGVPDGVIDAIVRTTSKDVLFRPKTARHALEVFRAAFDGAEIQPASREALAGLLKEPISSSETETGAGAALTGTMAETISQLAERKRDLRDGIRATPAIPAAPAHQDDPAHAERLRVERRKIRIAFWVASFVGTCATIAIGWFMVHNMGRWEQWVEVDLAHAKTITKVLPSGGMSFSRATPIWATVLFNLVPVILFSFGGVFASVLPYRLLRGIPLPRDSENTRCGWCQHELRGITAPICSECGHRVGDQSPDEQGILPLSRRGPARWMPWILFPAFFLLALCVARLILSAAGWLISRLAAGADIEPILTFIAIFIASATNLEFYEAFLQFRISHSGRAWCRICKGELHDLVEPVCPACGSRI